MRMENSFFENVHMNDPKLKTALVPSNSVGQFPHKLQA